ncbi:MAG TPA: BON domain-containing protein [Blastocatellia bacterium]|nr:BON domain-containing protein [Blastocatellia bacterium]
MIKRRTICLFLCLLLAGSVLAAQDKTTSKKSKPAPVDCSTVSDEIITENVKAKLAATPSLKDATINVATSGGVVTLTGNVKTSSLKGVATRMAKRVDCVKKVDNQLAYEQNTTRPPKKNSN